MSTEVIENYNTLKEYFTIERIIKIFKLNCFDCKNHYHNGVLWRCKICGMCKELDERGSKNQECHCNLRYGFICNKIDIDQNRSDRTKKAQEILESLGLR